MGIAIVKAFDGDVYPCCLSKTAYWRDGGIVVLFLMFCIYNVLYIKCNKNSTIPVVHQYSLSIHYSSTPFSFFNQKIRSIVHPLELHLAHSWYYCKRIDRFGSIIPVVFSLLPAFWQRRRLAWPIQ